MANTQYLQQKAARFKSTVRRRLKTVRFIQLILSCNRRSYHTNNCDMIKSYRIRNFVKTSS